MVIPGGALDRGALRGLHGRREGSTARESHGRRRGQGRAGDGLRRELANGQSEPSRVGSAVGKVRCHQLQ